MPKPRFSLRSLLGLAVLVALAGYWRDRPRQNANRMVALIEAGDFSAAEAMFNEPDVGVANRPNVLRSWHVELGKQTPGKWLRGRYPVTVTATPVGLLETWTLACEATALDMRRADKWTLYNQAPTILLRGDGPGAVDREGGLRRWLGQRGDHVPIDRFKDP